MTHKGINWNTDMSAAHRDGREVWVGDDDAGSFIMKWDAAATNRLFCKSDEVGMWVAPDGSFTWGSGLDGKSGPTRWAEFAKDTPQ